MATTTGATLVEVPGVIDELVADARLTLESFEVEVTVTEEANDDLEAGHVFAQDPDGGTKVEKDTDVKLKVSAGAEAASVPGVVGRNVDEARTILEDAGFTVRVEPSTDANTPADEVTDQDPAPLQEAPKGSPVTLFVGTRRRACRSTTSRAAPRATRRACSRAMASRPPAPASRRPRCPRAA